MLLFCTHLSLCMSSVVSLHFVLLLIPGLSSYLGMPDGETELIDADLLEPATNPPAVRHSARIAACQEGVGSEIQLKACSRYWLMIWFLKHRSEVCHLQPMDLKQQLIIQLLTQGCLCHLHS